jgi:hypothetical protein
MTNNTGTFTQVIDLLSPAASTGENTSSFLPPCCKNVRVPGMALEHTCLGIDSFEDAETALAFARARSKNWGYHASERCKATRGCRKVLRNRAHAFVRLVLIDRNKGWLSMLHLVDLAGVLPFLLSVFDCAGTEVLWHCLSTQCPG